MAKRYIDADELMEKLGIAGECKNCQFVDGPFCKTDPDFTDVCEALADMPTADVVEVVRCKDCKHNPRNSNDEVCPWVDWDGDVRYFPEDDGFCKWGERRGEE